jgi:hypothetical protein
VLKHAGAVQTLNARPAELMRFIQSLLVMFYAATDASRDDLPKVLRALSTLAEVARDPAAVCALVDVRPRPPHRQRGEPRAPSRVVGSQRHTSPQGPQSPITGCGQGRAVACAPPLSLGCGKGSTQ